MERTQSGKKMRKSGFVRGGLIALAALMLLCGTYLVTLAYLNEKTTRLNNAFVPVDFVDTVLEIVEKEHSTLDLSDDGIYDEEGEGAEVTGETFYFAPGVTLKKHPYVKITNLPENAYLFISVDDGIDGNAVADKMALEWKVDPANWLQIEDATHKRMVYVYVGPHAAVGTNDKSLGILTKSDYTENDGKMDIILNDQVVVSPYVYDIQDTKPEKFVDAHITFSAYLVQATGFANYQEAWNSTYGK